MDYPISYRTGLKFRYPNRTLLNIRTELYLKLHCMHVGAFFIMFQYLIVDDK